MSDGDDMIWPGALIAADTSTGYQMYEYHPITWWESVLNPPFRMPEATAKARQAAMDEVDRKSHPFLDAVRLQPAHLSGTLTLPGSMSDAAIASWIGHFQNVMPPPPRIEIDRAEGPIGYRVFSFDLARRERLLRRLHRIIRHS